MKAKKFSAHYPQLTRVQYAQEALRLEKVIRREGWHPFNRAEVLEHLDEIWDCEGRPTNPKRLGTGEKAHRREVLQYVCVRLSLVCTNCTSDITRTESANNKGYCNECAHEAWGEGEPS